MCDVHKQRPGAVLDIEEERNVSNEDDKEFWSFHDRFLVWPTFIAHFDEYRPNESLQTQTTAETPRDLAEGQPNQEIQLCCEYEAFVCQQEIEKFPASDIAWGKEKKKKKTAKKKEEEAANILCSRWSGGILSLACTGPTSDRCKLQVKRRHVRAGRAQREDSEFGGIQSGNSCFMAERLGLRRTLGPADLHTGIFIWWGTGSSFPTVHHVGSHAKHPCQNLQLQIWWPWLRNNPTCTNTKLQPGRRQVGLSGTLASIQNSTRLFSLFSKVAFADWIKL